MIHSFLLIVDGFGKIMSRKQKWEVHHDQLVL